MRMNRFGDEAIADQGLIHSTPTTNSTTTTNRPSENGNGNENVSKTKLPHSGSLHRIKLHQQSEDKQSGKSKPSFIYAITIRTTNSHNHSQSHNNDHPDHSHTYTNHDPTISPTSASTYQLQFSPDQYTFLQNVFEILDTESVGVVHKDIVRDFVMLRCPVFKRRDADWKQYHANKYKTKSRSKANASHENGNKHDGTDLPGEFDPDLDIGNPFASPTDYENDNEEEKRNLPEFDAPSEDDDIVFTTTFDEVWDSVVSSDMDFNPHHPYGHLGVEGWMLFCRFIALAQYHDAKRRFSARHLQTVQNKNEQEHEHEQSELIIVDLPPLLEPPTPLDAQTLIKYDSSMQVARKGNMSGSGSGIGYDGFYQSTAIANVAGEGIPLPELDLDHSYISIYDDSRKLKFTVGSAREHTALRTSSSMPVVRVSVFGSNHLNVLANGAGASPGSGTSIGPRNGNSDLLEFVIKFLPNGDGSSEEDTVIVRRSFEDLEWLDETFKSHKLLGGTLCGRILPPFPSRLRSNASDFGVADNIYKKRNAANSTAVAVASAGVSAGAGIVSSAAKTAKSLWGSLPGSKQISKIVKTKVQSPGVKQVKQSFPKASYSVRNRRNKNETPESKARQTEKYLNYMLEHPALSSSFPLNLILKASQSGLEAAKRILKDQSQKRNDDYFSGEEDERMSSLRSSVFQYLPSPNQTKNLEWVRSAAQAALVLRLHGLLETAGYQSTSTTLQHASLPQFAQNNANEGSFEGAVNENAANTDVESCADDESDNECDGFDILPDPLPFPERSALCAGNVFPPNASDNASHTAYSTHDRYGTMQNTTLGDIEVERDIDRLRELLRRVDKSFASCCNALIAISIHRRSCDLLHVNILRNIDNWNGMRGKILSQRALLKGVTCLEDTSYRTESSSANFKEDMLWAASLANAAYSASKDVCGAVEAARTASRAKHTADIAATNAIQAEKDEKETGEEAKMLQERVSRSQMQALHAAVVEHEALAAKRRSVISLANDVKYWNTHRKRDLIKACSRVVKEQASAAAQNLNAWTQLRDGLLASTSIFDVGQKNQRDANRFEQNPLADTNSVQESQIEISNEEQMPRENIVVAATVQDYFSPQISQQDDEILFSPSLSQHDDELLPPIDGETSIPCRDVQQSISSFSEDALVFSDALSSSALSHDSIDVCEPDQELGGDSDSKNSERGMMMNEDVDVKDDMTESMQSLVDGLLTWGGGGNWEVEDELGLTLPKGMAASLAMEEREILDLA